MKTLALTMTACAATFGALAVFEASLLSSISEENKAQHREWLCFDQNGKVDRMDGNWAKSIDCRTVAIRELQHG